MDVPAWSLAGYDVEELAGYGVGSEVWRARETVTGAVVALKRLRAATDPAARDRLRHGAARLAAFRHPRVVALRSVVGASDGVVLILDHVDGRSLSSLLAERGRIGSAEVVALAGTLAGALAAAHARGLVHGDLSPASVLVDNDGQPWLTDLGLASLVPRLDQPPEMPTAYADPAAALRAGPTPAGDVYALAAICWQLLSGTQLGSDLSSRPDSLAAELSRRVPEVPPLLASVVAAALTLEASRRPDAATFGHQLASETGETAATCATQPVEDSASVASVAAGPTARLSVSGPAQRPVASPAASTAPPPAVRGVARRPRVAWPTLAVVVTIGAVALGWSLGHHGRPEVGVQLAVAAPPAGGVTEPADWTAVVAGLVQRRDLALARADQAGLLDADERGSPAAQADVAVVDALRADHAHADGLAHEVRSATVLASQPGTATLRVVDTMPAYALLAPDGAVLARHPDRAAAAWRVQLALGAAGWRIRTIQPERDDGG